MPLVNVDENSIIGYHFHIYYYPNDSLDEIAIDQLFNYAKDQWGKELRVVMWKQIIGPHTLPFFEIDIIGKDLVQKHFTQVFNWVMMQCGGHGNGAGEKGRPVLLHPVFENDSNQVQAHSIYSMWLGGRVPPVNLSVLKKFDDME